MATHESDPSQIRRPMPPRIRLAMEQREITDDQILVSTDSDLDIAGAYSESWVIVTKEKVMVFMIDEEDDEAILRREVDIANIETARMDTRVGSGFLEAKSNGVFEEIARFSNRNAEKFSKVAAKIKSLAQGKQVEVGVDDEVVVGRCRQCGVRLADKTMTVCPKCLNRGSVFFRFLALTKEFWPHTCLAMVFVVAFILLQLVPAPLTMILIDHVLTSQGEEAEIVRFREIISQVSSVPVPLEQADMDAPEDVVAASESAIQVLQAYPNLNAAEKELPKWFAFLVASLGMENDHEAWLYILVGLLFLTALATMIVTWLRERLAVSVANKLAWLLRQRVFRKLEELEVRYHDSNSVGQLMTRCSQDIEALQGFINQLTSGFGLQLLLLIAVAMTMFALNWQLALIACLPAPLVMLATVFFYKRIVPMWQKYWTTRHSLSNILNASLSGIRVVKAFAQEQREAERFGNYSSRFRDAGYRVGYANAFFYPIMGFVFQLGSFFIWLLGGAWVLQGLGSAAGQPGDAITVGFLVMFLGYLGLFYAPLQSLTQMSTWFTQFTTQAHRVFEVLDAEPEIIEPPDAIELEIQGAIAFRDVTFGYDPHIPILHDVSFHVNPGEMIGIVGHSGSGKSTTVNLMMRFYEATEGSVTIDNINIKKIKKNTLRRQIGIVAQDPFLFRGTISENIAYGNPNVAPENILDSALSAHAHMFITRVHDGYDTRLGERGAGLSGGERQRVAIARALLHNPRILILDEATSSVDTIAEREIQKALEALSLGRTTIAIAHRLTTLRHCDRILVFEEGNIREAGSHEELMELGGIYKKLVEIQSQLASPTDSVDGLKAIDEITQAEAINPEQADKSEMRSRLEQPRTKYLDPKQIHIYSMDEGGMQVSIRDQEDTASYQHVRAYRCFPVSRPSEFIALWTGDSALEHNEIGMIRRLKELAPSSRLAVEHELSKRYFIHYIQRIKTITDELGFLQWDVITDKGDMEFLTKRWERNTVTEGGRNGRIILDVDNNRYEIENLDALDEASRAMYTRHIFW
jgi:ATP-binding cassette subfamily B protein